MSTSLVRRSTSDILDEAQRFSEAFQEASRTRDVTSDAFKSLSPTCQQIILTKANSFAALSSVSGSRGWWPLIRELSAGGWQRNEDIELDTALSNPTLYACITLIAGDIGKLRPKLVEQDSDDIWLEVDRESPFLSVLSKPNHYQTRIDFFEWWMLSKLVHGNTYALKARDGRGIVRALYILDPVRVTPLVAPDGSVFYQLIVDELNQQFQEGRVVPAREIIHDVMCPLFHPLVGVSPIYAAGWPAIQGLNIRRNSDKFFSNGSKPGGVLTAPGPIAQATADRLKAYWDENFSGDNIGKIAVLGDGLKYEAMAMSAQDADLVKQLQMTDEDIARCFHMPRHKVGIGPDPTYNNIEALNQQYYSDCLQKHIEKLEIHLDEGLELTTASSVNGRPLGVEFDLDDLLRMDSATRVKTALDAIKAGASVNEVRFRYHDLGPVDGGETPFLQEQNWPIRLLAEREMPSERPPTPPAPMPGEARSLAEMDWKAARAMYQKALAA
jgi:HK97 family phage portal protein